MSRLNQYFRPSFKLHIVLLQEFERRFQQRLSVFWLSETFQILVLHYKELFWPSHFLICCHMTLVLCELVFPSCNVEGGNRNLR